MINKNDELVINKIVSQHPSIRHAAELEAICAPLNQLGITYFSHVHVNQQQEFAGLGKAHIEAIKNKTGCHLLRLPIYQNRKSCNAK